MLGRMTIQGDSTVPGTRCRPDAILATVHVFPHGACAVREQCLDLLATPEVRGRFPSWKRAGLQPYRDPQQTGRAGEETEPRILEANPWVARPDGSSAPSGYYENAGGRTHLWVDYWYWQETSFWDKLFRGGSARQSPPDFTAFLEVSGLTWQYDDMGDYETSVVIELHEPHRYDSGPGRDLDPPHLDRLREAAQALAAHLEAVLRATPAPAEAEARRQARMAAIEQAQREQAEQLAHQQPEHQALRDARQRADRAHAEYRAQQRAARRVAVLYDTSYLMTDLPPLHRELTALRQSQVTNVVSEEIKQELQNHIDHDDGDKRVLALHGRQRITDLAEERLPWVVGYQEVRMSDAAAPQKYSASLNPDSATDSLLIEYGLYLLQSQACAAVVLATADSGIRYYCATDLWQKHRIPLFGIADPGNPDQSAPLSEFLGVGGPPPVTAHVEEIWKEFDVVQDGRLGMRIHVWFSLAGRRGETCHLAVLYSFIDGQPLKDFNQAYRTAQGDVCVGRGFTPSGDDQRFEDFQLFMPYDELHLTTGRHDLSYRACLYDSSDCLAVSSDWICWVNIAAP
ncbi:MAG TPA: hypothetical protein PKY50_15220 [Candidatus Competibacter sp.]|nr:hypothetical protein [Candidatus Competibacter sp.]